MRSASRGKERSGLLGLGQGGRETSLTDADGERHTYEVFDKFVVDLGTVRVRRPVEGKSEVSLQTRSLPDYFRRLIVQGKLKSTG
jgi:sortase A